MITPHPQEELASEVFSFNGYFMFMRKDGIIHVQFEAGFVGGLEHARHQVSIINQLRGNRKALVLAIYEEDNSFSKEAREYVASDEVSDIVAADAFVIKGLALRILGNGYLRINKPRRPGRLFNSRTQAIAWLKKFKEL